ncbi:uncharacterized protein LOC143242900 isoform X7 [Tachypleus tridentatus]|uniref:uncharacterized protein LOC143242900 isoform X7 n=1 Tax=Tachypleus tridentatus TaxID=6853 RepID=UPI003FCF8BDE
MKHPIKSSFPDEVTGGVLSKVKRKLGLLEVSKMPQCAPYFSENTVKCHRVFGDFQVSLHKRQVEEHYTISIFRLYNLQALNEYSCRFVNRSRGSSIMVYNV